MTRSQLIDALRTRWIALLREFSVDSTAATSVSADVFSEIVNAYSEPHRFYHTLDHIQSVFLWVDRLRSNARDLPAILLAIWFHDAVYDARSNDNEERSAAYAMKVLNALNIPASKIKRVGHLILATKHHVAEPTDGDAQIMLDADLAILGANPIQYQAYAAAIRQEYAWVSDADYRVGRCRVLQAFLSQSQIYFTASVLEELDATARSNLKAEIRLLNNSFSQRS